MASRRQGGLLGISEDLLGRITELPGAKNLLDGLNTLRDRVDELSGGSRPKRKTPSRSSGAKRPASRKPTGQSKPPPSMPPPTA